MTSAPRPPENNVVQLTIIRDTLEQAEVVRPEDFEVSSSDGNDNDGPAPKPQSTLPEGCPIAPLGMKGGICYLLNKAGEYLELPVGKLGRLEIQGLLGTAAERVTDFWPKFGKEGSVTGWRPEIAAQQIIAGCAAQGLFNPMDRIRGPGAWLGDDGELILHCGDTLLIEMPNDDQLLKRRPGRQGWHIYTAAPALQRPQRAPAHAGPYGPAEELLKDLKTWHFRRGELDAVLMLGWFGAAQIAGALKWRPLAWITGGAGTGKSTLLEAIGHVFGKNGAVRVSDATAAGIWQKLGYAALPVILDEQEAEEDNRQNQKVIKLARQAASGGVVLRGGQDHSGAEFVARSCFLFTSINVPPLLGQDRSRLAILELNPLRGGPLPDLSPARLERIGRGLRRRLLDGWPRLPEVLKVYGDALARHGHSARGVDQYGTLLACADILRFDNDHGGSSDYADELARKLDARELAQLDDSDITDEERCLQHLLTCRLEVHRDGQRATIEALLRAASRAMYVKDSDEQKILITHGLRVFEDDTGRYLLVANCHTQLALLYERTHWAARSGASGVWVQALRRLPGARPATDKKFGRVKSRGTLIPLDMVLEGED